MTNKTAALRYARALLDVAVKERAPLDAIGDELAAFVDLFKQNPSLEKVMLHPAVPVQRKRAVMVVLIERAGLSPILAKLLVLLAERDRPRAPAGPPLRVSRARPRSPADRARVR